MRELLQCPGLIFLAGVLVTPALLVGVLLIADALRKKRIKKSGAPTDSGELKRIVDNPQEQNKAPQKNYESFRNFAAGVNSIGVLFLLAGGGVWTFYTFSQTRQLEFTQLQREKLLLDKAKLEEDTRKYFQIQLELKATQLNFPNTKNAPRYIRVDVSWGNPGNWVPKERAQLHFEEFKLIRVEAITPDGAFEFYDLVPSERDLKIILGLGRGGSMMHVLTGSNLSSHFSKSETAIQLVTVPGVYMIWIKTKLGDWEPDAVTFIDVK